MPMFYFRPILPSSTSPTRWLGRSGGQLADAVAAFAKSQPLEPAIDSQFLPHRDGIVRLDVPIENAGETCLRAFWPHDECELAIYPPTLLERLGVWVGLQDIEIGDREFDDRYRILGRDPAQIRRICTPLVVAMVRRLAALEGRGDIAWQIGQREFRVSRPGRLADPTLRQRFLRWSLELYDQVLELVASDAAGLSPVMLAPEQACCGVCGELCGGEILACERCQTPHHADCWQYNGRCSRFGCGYEFARPMAPRGFGSLRPRGGQG